MKRLLYVSESNIEQAIAGKTISDIVAGAQVRNAQLHLTGALIFSNTYFAQVLEGPKGAVSQMMISIKADTRHRNINVVDESLINDRKFSDWKMAYHGPSQFVSRHVSRLLQPASLSEQIRASEWLTELALEFSRQTTTKRKH